ncbi:MAG: type III toxin-antitoxin system ToxN/AbiQ family toxin [Clostridia bacterium]|nr:type III toxin-antitoxin system ToxN/AbiQ family toxin [Clostridia bacterium]
MTEVTFENFGFYRIDSAYLKYLHNIDCEVQYTDEKDYDKKPFIGILVLIGDYDYFIPLSSPKDKHKSFRKVGRDYYLIYQPIDQTDIKKNDIIVQYQDGSSDKLLAFLDIKKMIPVPKQVYLKVDFNKEPDKDYVALLMKEYLFCQQIQNGICTKASKVYEAQKKTGKVHQFFCNYAKLEVACDQYQKES